MNQFAWGFLLVCNIPMIQLHTLCSQTQYTCMYARLHKNTLRILYVIEGHWTTKYEQLHFTNYEYIALDSFSIVNINLAGNMVWLICNKMQKQNTRYISEKNHNSSMDQFAYINWWTCMYNKQMYNLNNTVLIIKHKIDIVKHISQSRGIIYNTD